MVDGTLGTTNILLVILAAVSALEAVALAVVVIVTIRVSARAIETIREAQEQLRPLTKRANEIAAVVESVATDVKDVTARAASCAEKAGMAFQTAVDVVGLVRGTARASIASRSLRLLGVMRGLRVAYRILIGDTGLHPIPASEVRRRRNGQQASESAVDPPHAIDQITEVVHGA